MSRRPVPSPEYQQRRNDRMRALRSQREAPMRRRRQAQPVLFVLWIGLTIVGVAFLLWLGFTALFAPRVMAWIEENPGSIEHGIVQDFVEWYRPEVLADDPASAERRRISFEVPEGANDTEIGRALFEASLIKSQVAFQYAVLQAGREGTLPAGTYDLSPTMRPSQIVDTLVAISRGPELNVTIREGMRLEEVVAALANTELTMNLEAFADLVRNPPPELLNRYDFLDELREGRTLEGYLYPSTYTLFVNSSPGDVITKLLGDDTGGFAVALTQEIRDGIAAKGLSIDRAVILASIVEREAVVPEERPLIAGVFLNRINNPTGETAGLLNADPTIQYGVASDMYLFQQQLAVDQWGTVEWWPQLQTSPGEIGREWPEELAPFQTYFRAGLPPAPIANPGIDSIAAVASADTASGYLYFVAACPNGSRDGSHYFATTLGEHQANIARANQECAGA
jgi:UPF0755 protein